MHFIVVFMLSSSDSVGEGTRFRVVRPGVRSFVRRVRYLFVKALNSFDKTDRNV